MHSRKQKMKLRLQKKINFCRKSYSSRCRISELRWIKKKVWQKRRHFTSVSFSCLFADVRFTLYLSEENEGGKTPVTSVIAKLQQSILLSSICLKPDSNYCPVFLCTGICCVQKQGQFTDTVNLHVIKVWTYKWGFDSMFIKMQGKINKVYAILGPVIIWALH